MEPAASTAFGHQLIHTRFNDGTSSALDHFNFGWIHVYADNPVAMEAKHAAETEPTCPKPNTLIENLTLQAPPIRKSRGPQPWQPGRDIVAR
jgi:hypothetical protein